MLSYNGVLAGFSVHYERLVLKTEDEEIMFLCKKVESEDEEMKMKSFLKWNRRLKNEDYHPLQ